MFLLRKMFVSFLQNVWVWELFSFNKVSKLGGSFGCRTRGRGWRQGSWHVERSRPRWGCLRSVCLCVSLSPWDQQNLGCFINNVFGKLQIFQIIANTKLSFVELAVSFRHYNRICILSRYLSMYWIRGRDQRPGQVVQGPSRWPSVHRRWREFVWRAGRRLDGAEFTRYQLGGKTGQLSLLLFQDCYLWITLNWSIFYPRPSVREPWVSRLIFYC